MKSMMRDYSEKRDFMRMKVDSAIELRLPDRSRSLQGICRDLSGTGMGIEVAEAFEIGAELDACLPSSNANFPPFQTRVRVIRITRLDNGNQRLGVEIVNIND
jgi:c-di-GMP-binding flagellar brake protein YcgR